MIIDTCQLHVHVEDSAQESLDVLAFEDPLHRLIIVRTTEIGKMAKADASGSVREARSVRCPS
jgi:hypothetical protein